ncbi:hypothetical protein XOCgx_3813 [Xanthomonas oryzae pv. oryzicola]|nr:hypothetical protein XOCgx_3813 [Xanthomonas oryzae pv. oryzicola]
MGSRHCPLNATDSEHVAGFYSEDMRLMHQVLQTCDQIVEDDVPPHPE